MGVTRPGLPPVHFQPPDTGVAQCSPRKVRAGTGLAHPRQRDFSGRARRTSPCPGAIVQDCRPNLSVCHPVRGY